MPLGLISMKRDFLPVIFISPFNSDIESEITSLMIVPEPILLSKITPSLPTLNSLYLICEIPWLSFFKTVIIFFVIIIV